MSNQHSPDLHIFGIRHHGPGSAGSLRAALDEAQPDIILVEGPPEANQLLHWLAHPDMEPPVALIVYRPDQPNRATTYPFAIFSPELQAIRYGLARNRPVRFMDLPQTHQLAANLKPPSPEVAPFRRLAEAAGYKNYEAWWNWLVEQRQNSTDVFQGILEMMQAMRQAATGSPPEAEAQANQRLANQREAYMRCCLRQARTEGYRRIAAVCGAWHAPALTNLDNEAADVQLLDGLPSLPVEVAWAPWTYSRLSYYTGYGAGISSPGWYHHLWEMGQRGATSTEVSTHWLIRVANLLREQGFEASSAHIIEAVRLAEALAAMRELPLPGLAELNEATQTVICFGDAAPMRLIQEKLIISERMGALPPDTPMVPLQRDLYQLQKRLRLRAEPAKSTLTLDLRQSLHLERSHLLHRLHLLNIPWGKTMSLRGKKGTFREVWQLQWLPDFAARVIEASVWGNTVEEAAANFGQDQADRAADLAALTRLLDQIILADLPETIIYLMKRIEDEAALSSDIAHMMEALPPLARILRYGNVRQTDQDTIRHVVDGLLRRICIGLPGACASLDDKTALEMFNRLTAIHNVVITLQNEAHSQQWRETLVKLADQRNLHGLLAGRACRLLLDAAYFTATEATIRLERALSTPTLANQQTESLLQAAFWLEGFLSGSGLLLFHDQTLWRLLDSWVDHLEEAQFLTVLPLLRRTFAAFDKSVRQRMLERIRQVEQQQPVVLTETASFDHEQAEAVLPLLAQLLGLSPSKSS